MLRLLPHQRRSRKISSTQIRSQNFWKLEKHYSHPYFRRLYSSRKICKNWGIVRSNSVAKKQFGTTRFFRKYFLKLKNFPPKRSLFSYLLQWFVSTNNSEKNRYYRQYKQYVDNISTNMKSSSQNPQNNQDDCNSIQHFS